MAAIMHHFIFSLMYIREHTTLILRELNFDSSLLCSFIHGCVASDTSLSRSSARTESWESRPPEPPSVLRHLPGVRAIRFLGERLRDCSLLSRIILLVVAFAAHAVVFLPVSVRVATRVYFPVTVSYFHFIYRSCFIKIIEVTTHHVFTP